MCDVHWGVHGLQTWKYIGEANVVQEDNTWGHREEAHDKLARICKAGILAGA